MDFIFKRKINYYETDRMGIVHHSNYIRYLEEARCEFLNTYEMPFTEFEKNDITIPVLGVNCKYQHHVTFDDTILIQVFVKEYNGVRLTISYSVIDEKTGKDVILAETKHCFTNKNLRPVNLKKAFPEYSQKFEKAQENYQDYLKSLNSKNL